MEPDDRDATDQRMLCDLAMNSRRLSMGTQSKPEMSHRMASGQSAAYCADMGSATRAGTVTDWEEAAAAVLRKAGRVNADSPDGVVWDRLTRVTVDGLPVPPLGVPGDADEVPTARRNLTRTAWEIRVPTHGGSAGLAELEAGASALWLRLAPRVVPADFDTALEGVLIDLAPVILDSPTDQLNAARSFCEWLSAQDVRAAAGTGLGADPIGRVVSGQAEEEEPEASLETIVELLAALASDAGILGFVVDATVMHDRGASDVQELAYSLAAGVAYLRLLVADGYGIDEALRLLEFRYAATDEQFLTIAKFRAARQLWARVGEICNADGGSRAQRQHAVTSRAMMTRYDPWVNMLRTTVAAFAAGTGGADAITVLPFDSALGEPDDFGRRIARNTSLLLMEESHVATVADPAAGAYAVERLTDELARAAWAEFGRIEEAGGVLSEFRDGSTGWERIRKSADTRAAAIATRKRPITGVSEFPLQSEELLVREAHRPWEWDVASYSAGFEALRDEGEQVIEVVALGSLADHAARAGFAANLFAAGGLRIDNPGSYAGAPLVCLVGTDQAYAASGAETITALRAAGARHIVVMGKPGELAVDDSFALGDDALAFLTRTRKAAR